MSILDADFDQDFVALDFSEHAEQRCEERDIDEREVMLATRYGIRQPDLSGSIVQLFRYVDIPRGHFDDDDYLDLVGLHVIFPKQEALIKTVYHCDRKCQRELNGYCRCWGAFRNKKPLKSAST